MADTYDESAPNTPLIHCDPNFKGREATIGRKSSDLYKDYGTPVLVAIKVDGGYNVFESVKGEWSKLTSQLHSIRKTTTSDNYTAISEATTDDSYARKRRKRARRCKPRRKHDGQTSPHESSGSVTPPNYRSQSPSTSQPAVGSLQGPTQSLFTFIAPTDRITSPKVPQPDNSGLLPDWTEWSQPDNSGLIPEWTEWSQPDNSGLIPVWTEEPNADQIGVPQGVEDMLAEGDEVDWEAEFAALVEVNSD